LRNPPQGYFGEPPVYSIGVDNVDMLFDEFKGRGAHIVEPPTIRAYKCSEMVVEDKLGFRLAFAQDISDQG